MRVVAGLLVLLLVSAPRADEPPLRLIDRIALPDGQGRIDHLALDPERQRLFVAELGNDAVAVVDLAGGQLSGRISGIAEPQGVVFVPALDRLFVTSGASGSVEVISGATLAIEREVPLGGDADNVRYDARAHEVYVGYGNGALARLAAASGAQVADIALAGHPESFQLEATGERIFVNLPAARAVAVVERAQGKVEATWQLAAAGSNFPMALAEAQARLYIAARHPAALIVLDTASAKEVARSALCDDADDLFVDARRRLLYASCGEGFLDVLALGDAAPQRIARLATAPGARTSLLVPERDRLYVGAPHRGAQPAEILVYQPTS